VVVKYVAALLSVEADSGNRLTQQVTEAITYRTNGFMDVVELQVRPTELLGMLLGKSAAAWSLNQSVQDAYECYASTLMMMQRVPMHVQAHACCCW
jgi:hypothetical protein